MPNWCTNVIKVYGCSVSMKAFYAKFSDPKVFAFGDFVPMPDGILNNNSDVEGWYDWTTQNWGTKWDVKDGDQEPSDANCATYYENRFETAWAPPLPLLEAVAKQFPDLNVSCSYHEEGMQFVGYSWWKLGTLNQKVYHEYQTQEEYQDLIRLYSEDATAGW